MGTPVQGASQSAKQVGSASNRDTRRRAIEDVLRNIEIGNGRHYLMQVQKQLKDLVQHDPKKLGPIQAEIEKVMNSFQPPDAKARAVRAIIERIKNTPVGG